MDNQKIYRYISDNINTSPDSTIKFILTNSNYLPKINNRWIELLMKKHNLTDEDIRNAEDIDINTILSS